MKHVTILLVIGVLALAACQPVQPLTPPPVPSLAATETATASVAEPAADAPNQVSSQRALSRWRSSPAVLLKVTSSATLPNAAM